MPASNAFGTFMETRDLLRSSDQGSANTPGSVELGPASQDDLLALLKGTFPVELPELMARTNLPLDVFADGLSRLERAGLVVVETTDDGQVARLTDRGASLAFS